MNDSSLKKCPTCGATFDAEGVSGCPRCLMLAALQPTRHTESADRPPPPSLAAVSAAFPQLEILELIGQGGMGCVFKARQPQLNRFVALKILPEALSRDAAFAARFTREAQALAALSHPNIVTIHDFGQAGGFFFLLMEFVDGVNLRLALRGGRFTPEQALAIVPPLCDALQFAHERGIVHRDIKPENLLLDKEGRIKVADFGIAKMLGADGALTPSLSHPMGEGGAAAPGEGSLPSSLTGDSAAGTPGYMAPEQKATPQRVDRRADIYSLGVVFYEMLTGELPAEQIQPPSRKVQIDVRLDEIVLRALEKAPELRYQTAGEFRTQVETVVSTPGGSGREGAPTSPAAPPFLKLITSTLTTPAELKTLHGQFFAYRTRGQLILDGQQLTHTRAGQTTVIPLTAIRDVSLGQYPRSMNPAGIALVSLTYEEAGQPRQVLLSPMDGWFAFPSTWDAHAADWHAAIRAAVKAATGREPTTTPREQLGIPGGFPWLQLAMIGVPLVAGLGLFLTSLSLTGKSPRSVLPVVLITLALTLGFIIPSLFIPWATRRRAATPPAAPGTRSTLWGYGLALLCVPLVIHLLMLPVQLVLPEPARRGAPLPIGFPEAIILAVIGVLGLLRWRRRPAAPSGHFTPSGRGRNLFGVGLICLGMFIGGLKIQEASRDHVQRAHRMAAEIPRLQQQWLAAGNEVFAANTELNRHIVKGPLARTDAERQRHAIEQGRLEGEVSKATTRQNVVSDQMRTVQDQIAATPFPFAETAASVLKWALPFALLGLLVLCWPRRGEAGSKPLAWKYSGLLMLLMPVLLLGALFLQFRAQVTSPSGVTHFESELVGVSNNVAIVAVTTEVRRGSAELVVGFTGPRLSPETEAALREQFFPPFAGIFVKPMANPGNFPSRIQPASRQTWLLGFVLPDAALAQQAAAQVRLIGSLPAIPDPTFVVTLFQVHQTNGQVYQASLHVAPPRTAADAAWVTLSGQFMENDTTCLLTWEILASQPGTARFRREGYHASSSLQLDPKTKLHRATASLELTRVSTNRVRLVTKMGYSSRTEEMTGNFRELADELRRTEASPAKTVSGVSTELCRVQGQPLTVMVEAAAPRPPSRPFSSVKSSLGALNYPLFALIALGAIVFGFGGVALLVWLLRKGGASKRIVLLVLGVPFLLLAVSVAALVGWRWAAGGMSLEKFERMQLFGDYPSNPHPTGHVQQTQNGFRLQLPRGQLASIEFLIRQADDSLQPVPALAALVAAGTNTPFSDRLYWTLRRNGTENASEYWSWSVTAHDGSGRALPQLTDHGTNFSHALAPGETLDWWNLALPNPLTFGAGEEKLIPLFRTHGTATTGSLHPKEAWLRVRCAALPAGFVTNGTPRIELGLAAHALLAGGRTALLPPSANLKPVPPRPGASTNDLELERRITSAKPGWMWLKAGGEKAMGQQLLLDPADGLYHGGVVIRLEKSEGHQKGPEHRARLGYGFAGMSTPWGTVTSAQAFEDGATAFRQQVAKLDGAPLPVPVEGEFVELIRLQGAVVSVALTYNGKSAPGEVPPQAEKPASTRLARVRARLVDAQGQAIAKRTVFIVPPGQRLEQPPASAATRNDGTIELEIPVGEPFQVMLPRDGSLEGPRSKENMIGERGGPMNQLPTTIIGEMEIRFDGDKVDAHFRTLKAVEPAAPTGKARTKEEQVERDKTRAAALATAMQAIREGKFHILHEAGKHPPELTHDPETGYEIIALPVGGGPGFAELYNEAMRAHYRDRKEAQ